MFEPAQTCVLSEQRHIWSKYNPLKENIIRKDEFFIEAYDIDVLKLLLENRAADVRKSYGDPHKIKLNNCMCFFSTNRDNRRIAKNLNIEGLEDRLFFISVDTKPLTEEQIDKGAKFNFEFLEDGGLFN